MKFSRWILALVSLAALCATLAVADDKMSGEKSMEKSSKGTDVTAKLEARERAISDAFKNKDAAAFMKIVDKDGFGADPSGFSSVSMMGDMMKDYDVRSFTIDDAKATKISADAYLFTYTSHQDVSYKGQPLPNTVYASTLYVKRGNEWRAFYHQETPAMQMSSAGGEH